MCGFAGVIDFRQRPVEPGLVERMRRALHHRGPDDQCDLMIGGAGEARLSGGLGFCRLAILDLSPLGRQPMTSADGRIAVVFNGEIYNHAEIRARLEADGVRFRSRSDTEVLVELLARRWAAGIPELRGMFAFVAVDMHAGRVLMVRDRVGKKPLYYRFHDGRLSFASELKGLLADPETPRRIDAEALQFYLRYQYVPAPRAILEGVRKVEPASVVACSLAGCSSERYWRVQFQPKIALSFSEAVPEVRRRVEEAVRVRLESDVPLGAFLSGGVDSSIVTAVMSAAMPGRVKTFSIGFDEARYDERPYATEVARRFDTEHHEFVVRMDAIASLPELAHAYDEPFADSSALPTYHVSRLTRQHVTVALSGDGGDEVFGGYERYAANIVAGAVAPLARIPPVAWLGNSVFRRRDVPASRSLGRAARRFWDGVSTHGDASRYAGWMSGMQPADVARLRQDDAAARTVAAYLEAQYGAGTEQLGSFDRMQRLDLLTYLPEDLLVKVDRASMANSLEVRAPLLDHELIEFAARLPAAVRTPRLRAKALLKAAFPEIPASVTGRRKTGFGVPVAAWFKSALGVHYEEMALAPDARGRQWFDPAAARALLDEHRAGTADHSVGLWTLLMFEHWHRAHLG
jgi:asparagine synthase (glutamine-hydrolysing)